jgi:hypothetical protein
MNAVPTTAAVAKNFRIVNPPFFISLFLAATAGKSRVTVGLAANHADFA